MKETNKKNFTDREVGEVVERFFFMDSEMKKEIIREFRTAKEKYGNMVDYVIVPKKVDHTPSVDQPEQRKNVQEIQLQNLEDYRRLIQFYAQNEDMKTLGANPLLAWDLDFLRKIMTLIDGEFRMRLMEERDRYCPTELVTSFIGNAMAYALVNHCFQVSQREILATFKAWDYCSFSLKKEMVDRIFEVENVKEEMYPFYKRTNNNKGKVYNKVIPFPTKNKIDG